MVTRGFYKYYLVMKLEYDFPHYFFGGSQTYYFKKDLDQLKFTSCSYIKIK